MDLTEVYRITTGSDKMDNKKLFPTANRTETQGHRFWYFVRDIEDVVVSLGGRGK